MRHTGALVQFEGVFTDLLDAPRDPVPVLRTHAVEDLEHHQIEGPLKDVQLGSGGVLWPRQRVLHSDLWDVDR